MKKDVMRAGKWLRALLCMFMAVSLIPEVHAQQKTVRIGFLALNEAYWNLPDVQSFIPELARLGWVQGKNLAVEVRYAHGNDQSYAESARELVQLKVDIIYAYSAPTGRAAFAATRSIPIVIKDYTNDPLVEGYAEKINRPGKNVTGVFLDAPEFASKWVEMLKAIEPRLKNLGILWDPGAGHMHLEAVRRAADSLGLKTTLHEIHKAEDFEPAFANLRGRSQAVVILPSPMAYTYAKQLADLARTYKLPATSIAKQFAQFGGAISYGPDNTEASKRCVALMAKILTGTHVGEIPIERPYKFDFLINMKTVTALKLRVPDYLVLAAERVE